VTKTWIIHNSRNWHSSEQDGVDVDENENLPLRADNTTEKKALPSSSGTTHTGGKCETRVPRQWRRVLGAPQGGAVRCCHCSLLSTPSAFFYLCPKTPSLPSLSLRSLRARSALMQFAHVRENENKQNKIMLYNNSAKLRRILLYFVHANPCDSQWSRDRRRSRDNFRPLNFRLSEKLSKNLLDGKFSSRNAKFKTGKFPFWKNLTAKLKFRAPILSFVKSLQLYLGILSKKFWCLPKNCKFLFRLYFFTHDAVNKVKFFCYYRFVLIGSLKGIHLFSVFKSHVHELPYTSPYAICTSQRGRRSCVYHLLRYS